MVSITAEREKTCCDEREWGTRRQVGSVVGPPIPPRCPPSRFESKVRENVNLPWYHLGCCHWERWGGISVLVFLRVIVCRACYCGMFFFFFLHEVICMVICFAKYMYFAKLYYRSCNSVLTGSYWKKKNFVDKRMSDRKDNHLVWIIEKVYCLTKILRQEVARGSIPRRGDRGRGRGLVRSEASKASCDHRCLLCSFASLCLSPDTRSSRHQQHTYALEPQTTP